MTGLEVQLATAEARANASRWVSHHSAGLVQRSLALVRPTLVGILDALDPFLLLGELAAVS